MPQHTTARLAGALSAIAVLHTLIAVPPCASQSPEPTAAAYFDLEPKDPKRSRVVPIRIYQDGSGEARPVILFSHGLGGSRENNPYLANHWVAAGYTCVFMQHAGSDREVIRGVRVRDMLGKLKAAASARSSIDRGLDVPFVIDQLERWNKDPDHRLHKQLDLEHIGMAGHSFGAATTLGVAGRRFPIKRNFHEPRIDAFLPMSPQPGAGLTPEQAFAHIESPMLCMTGTKDGSPIDPRMNGNERQKVYAAFSPGDKYQLVFDGAQHYAFGDSNSFRIRRRDPDHHPAILAISTKFWDAYLKEDAAAKTWLQSDRPKSEHLKASDSWQWK